MRGEIFLSFFKTQSIAELPDTPTCCFVKECPVVSVRSVIAERLVSLCHAPLSASQRGSLLLELTLPAAAPHIPCTSLIDLMALLQIKMVVLDSRGTAPSPPCFINKQGHSDYKVVNPRTAFYVTASQ